MIVLQYNCVLLTSVRSDWVCLQRNKLNDMATIVWKSRTTVTHGSWCPPEHGTILGAFLPKRANKVEFRRGWRDNWHTRRHKVATLDKKKTPFVGVCKQLFVTKRATNGRNKMLRCKSLVQRVPRQPMLT